MSSTPDRDERHALPEDAPPIPEHAPDDAPGSEEAEELERLRREITELRAGKDAANAQKARTDALSAAESRIPSPARGVVTALAEFIPAGRESEFATALLKALQAAQGPGVGRGGLNPGLPARLGWRDAFRR